MSHAPHDNGAYVKAAERLRERARMYQEDDGSPGPMASVWGWRDIARWLRYEADRLLDPDAKPGPIR